MANDILDFEEKRIEKLSPKELRTVLMQLPIRRRMELILKRPDTEAVVGALAEQDFYLSVKEAGPDDSLPLLAHARVAQLNHLFDLEWWRKDDILPVNCIEWLERLSKANQTKLLEWLYQADFVLLVALFNRWIRVDLLPEDIDPVEAREQLPANTLDDQYFWEATYPQYEDFIKSFLSMIFEVNYGFYKELMNHLLWAVGSEVEEEAYRFHRGRLEDTAIPDFYDALEIYGSIRPEEVLPGKELVETDNTTPAFALALVEGDLLQSALREVQENGALMDTLQLEMAAVANKVVVADQLPPDSPEALHFAVSKAAGYVNLGLQIMSHGNIGAAARQLEHVYLEQFFRLGHSMVSQLKARVQREIQSGWISQWPEGVKVLDTYWMEAVELLLGKTPRFLRPSGSPGTAPREDIFRTLEDVARGEDILNVMKAAGTIFKALDVRAEKLKDELWPHGQVRTMDDVTLGVMLWTAAACAQDTGRWEVAPIPVSHWAEIFPKLLPTSIHDAIRKWMDQVEPDAQRRSLLDEYLVPLLKEYSEEMAAFSEATVPEPQFVRFFLFTEGG